MPETLHLENYMSACVITFTPETEVWQAIKSQSLAQSKTPGSGEHEAQSACCDRAVVRQHEISPSPPRFRLACRRRSRRGSIF
jgi:hypothetical protein